MFIYFIKESQILKVPRFLENSQNHTKKCFVIFKTIKPNQEHFATASIFLLLVCERIISDIITSINEITLLFTVAK